MRMRVQPFHQLLVQSRTGLLGHRLVGGVAYEQVTKPESVVAGNLGTVGADQLLADESEEMRSDAGTDRLGGQLEHGATMKDLALHRSALDHCSLVAAKPIETGLQQCVDRRRHDHLRI